MGKGAESRGKCGGSAGLRRRWPGFDRRAEVAWVRAQRKTMLAEAIKGEKRALAERLAATRRLFGRRVMLCDIHTHTTFSDGVSTVAENRKMAEILGLDFLFITDHRTLRQRRYCDAGAGVLWGQEPPSRGTDIGLLMNEKLFVPRCESLAADFRRAQKAAPFVWIAHPVGYGRNHWYAEEVVRSLWELGDRFALEVLNGGGKINRAYNAISAKAVSVWDELLCDGREVTVVGGSDAHICHSIGTAWTGVYPGRAGDVVGGLATGHTFASEGPLLWLSCGSRMMGDSLRRKAGAKVLLHFTAADAAGLHSVRVVSDGKVVREVRGKDAPLVAGGFEGRVGSRGSYFRVECTAADQRRAFSSPIFFGCAT